MLETRLDKRAELIKERRYGGLIVANDPKIAYSSEPSVDVTAAESDKSKESETIRSVGSPVLSGGESIHSPSKPEPRHTSFGDGHSFSTSSAEAVTFGITVQKLRTQADKTVSENAEVAIEDAEELVHRMSTTLIKEGGSEVPDFGSDDSDGPPSDTEFA